MTKKSMGQFMAVLRKAQGMTQQEVADRLNVSNKAVSRWERDECAPDLMLIPAIAEMFGVTCDELLKGERIMEPPKTEKSEPRVDKQLKTLVNRALSSFKTMIWISLALSAVGLICMLVIFGICMSGVSYWDSYMVAYETYIPVLAMCGFCVTLLLEVAAFVVAVIGTNKLKEKKTDNELFENADGVLVKKFHDVLGRYSFAAFYAVVLVVLVALPLVGYFAYYMQMVVPVVSYFLCSYVLIIIVLALIFLKGKEPYTAWITEQPCGEVDVDRACQENVTTDETSSKAVYVDKANADKANVDGANADTTNANGANVNKAYATKKTTVGNNPLKIMNRLQLGAVILATILFVISPWFEADSPYKASNVMIGINIVGLLLLLANLIFFAVFMVKCKEDRGNLVWPGIRNVLMSLPSLVMAQFHRVGYEWIEGWTKATKVYEKYDVWHDVYLYMAIGLVVLLILLFEVIQIIWKKRKGK